MTGTEYIKKLEETYRKNGLEEKWNHLMKIKSGITEKNKRKLLKEYPEFPEALLKILDFIDGTYWRTYGEEEVAYYFFGSDIDNGEYPYYLFSFNDIMENVESVLNMEDLFYYFLNEPDEKFGPFVDEKIIPDVDKLKWINFADCMNNGGTSSLYIDLTPSEKGKKGQIVRYLHDPDELKVIADSFEDFLDLLANKGMKFIHTDDFEWKFIL